jgi:hypothetical protein
MKSYMETELMLNVKIYVMKFMMNTAVKWQ